jgi:hypothetical protein
MSDKPLNMSRRDAVKTLVGGLAAVPLVNLVATAAAYAEVLPEVTADHSTYAAFAYQENPTKESRLAAMPNPKADLPVEEQVCNNCMFAHAGQAADQPEGYLRCSLFMGYRVKEGAWCKQWAIWNG